MVRRKAVLERYAALRCLWHGVRVDEVMVRGLLWRLGYRESSVGWAIWVMLVQSINPMRSCIALHTELRIKQLHQSKVGTTQMARAHKQVVVVADG
jgi:hypothetical protein